MPVNYNPSLPLWQVKSLYYQYLVISLYYANTMYEAADKKNVQNDESGLGKQKQNGVHVRNTLSSILWQI